VLSNIKENLLKMKNISELMVDLGYSALFLQDKGIVKEVMELDKNIRNLEKENLKYIFKIRTSETEKIKLIELMQNIRDITNAAVDMCSLISGDSIPPVVKDVLEETEERIITAKVAKKSVLNNATVGEIKIRTFTKVNILSIKRGDKWIFRINRDTKIYEGDSLVGVGPAGAQPIFRKLAAGRIKKFL